MRFSRYFCKYCPQRRVPLKAQGGAKEEEGTKEEDITPYLFISETTDP